MTDREKYARANKDLWNEYTLIHKDSKFYDLDSFLAGKNTLRSIEMEELGDIRDKSVLHLQCHFGMDSLSLARLGAKVTGVDFSDKAIELAKELANQLELDAEFICCDIYDLLECSEEKFDIVFTTYGVLAWLHDLEKWARIIAANLNEGGVFLMVEQHPLTDIFENDSSGSGVEIKYSYFDRSVLELTADGSYADPVKKFAPKQIYEWTHTTGDIISSLVDSGLRIEKFTEYPFCMYQRFLCMEETSDGWWILPQLPELPMLFKLLASKA